MKQLRVLDLFSGIGGLSLGLERAGMITVGFCEREKFQRAILAKHWPSVPCFNDVREVTGERVRERCGPVDVVAGGFPCQDISVAGSGAGIEGARSGLWKEMLRIVREVRPDWVLVENVSALRTRGGDVVLADLDAEDYAAWPLVVGAWAVGAPHRRDRTWIVAHSRRGGVCGGSQAEAVSGAPRTAPEEVEQQQRRGPDHRDRGSAHAGGDGPGSLPAASAFRWPAAPGEPQHEWEAERVVAYTPSVRRAAVQEGAGGGRTRAGGPGARGAERGASSEPARAGAASARPGGARAGERAVADRDGDGRGEVGHGFRGDTLRCDAGPRPGARGAVAVARVGRPVDGLPPGLVLTPEQHRHNLRALAALGNAVVPQVVEMVGREIVRLHMAVGVHTAKGVC